MPSRSLPRWYSWREIERIAADLLRSSGSSSDDPDGPTDIEHLLEVHLGASVDYAGDTKPGVLGYTVMRGQPQVTIASWLTEAAQASTPRPGIVGRWRATLAHEAGHIILHRGTRTGVRPWATVTDGVLEDFDVDRNAALRSIEFQANMLMVALLMPEDRVVRHLLELTVGRAVFPPLLVDDVVCADLQVALADRFHVSHEMARIRLEVLGVRSRDR